MVASLLVAVAGVSGFANNQGSPPTAPEHVTSSYSVRGHVRTLVVTAHAGDVQVTGGTTGAVSVTQHVAFYRHAPTVTHRLAAGVLSLTSHCAANEFCSVSYDIVVPRATAVQVTDDVGTVELSALVGHVTATVNAGKIDLSALSGPVQATTHAGSIIGVRMSSAHVGLRVSTGEIDVSFSAPPAAISAITDIAAVLLRVPNDVPYHVTTSAAVGHINVAVTQSTAASRTITTRTNIGSITIEPSP